MWLIFFHADWHEVTARRTEDVRPVGEEWMLDAEMVGHTVVPAESERDAEQCAEVIAICPLPK
ncbi:hypothetical protein SAMN06265222_11936 [Neorhodopirellula lusitana]|uniref:Uncharacterized protein n=1 Tax=Neorhodopirellula lusitana TaxID=445327 RepID=A0ABY1QPW7_9BACT|nr:hypothetical protein [Neorhodopirellula lusitana]SMP75434.1 hypothetical protein SAMN06265222_11936 [Neorhodopirellula lusitana]